MPGPATPYRTADGWSWDGTAWRDAGGLPPAPPAVEERGRRARPAAVAAIVLAALLLASALGLAGDTGRPAHRLDALTGPMAARGLACGASPLAHAPARVWTCLRERRPWSEYVIAQFDDPARVDYLSVDMDGLAGAAPDPPRSEAFSLFRAALGFVFPDPATLGAARRWLDANHGTDGTARQFGRLVVALGLGNGRARLDVTSTDVDREQLNWYPLPHVTRDGARALMRARHMSCAPDAGFDYCEGRSAQSESNAGLTWSMAHPGRLTDLDVAVITPRPAAPARELFDAALDLVLAGPDLARAESWANGHLDGRGHRVVIAGLDLNMRPVDSGGGFDLHLAPAGWPGI